jgi:membrane protein
VSSEAPREPQREPLLTRLYGRGEALIRRIRRRYAWFDHLARAGGRYERVHSDLMAAGVTYFAFLGLFPVLLLAASIFGLFLARDALLQQQLFDSIRQAFPGQLGEQLVHEVQSAVGSAGVTGLVGLAGFLYAGLRTVDKLRIGMELIWKGEVDKPDVLRDNLQDLVALVALGGIGVVGLGLTGAVTSETSRVMKLLGLADERGYGVLTWLVGMSLALIVDVVIFLWLLRVVPSVSHPLRRLLPGALFGAAGFEVLKLIGGYYLTLISGSVSATAFGGAVGLLVWINLVARFSFFTAAWTATLRRVESASPGRPRDAEPVAA